MMNVGTGSYEQKAFCATYTIRNCVTARHHVEHANITIIAREVSEQKAFCATYTIRNCSAFGIALPAVPQSALRHTFGESEGKLLAREIRSAWDAKLNIVLLHEKDPARGGCEFKTFFLTTPHNLIEEGLYRQQLATPFEADEAHRKVSRSLLAKALGAKVSVLRGMDTLQNVSVQRKLTQRSSSMRSSSRNTTKQGS